MTVMEPLLVGDHVPWLTPYLNLFYGVGVLEAGTIGFLSQIIKKNLDHCILYTFYPSKIIKNYFFSVLDHLKNTQNW